MWNWPKIVVVTLADNMQLLTAGGGTSWAYRVIALPTVEDVGPYLESIRLAGRGQG